MDLKIYEDRSGEDWRPEGEHPASVGANSRASSHVEMSLHCLFSLLLLTTKSLHVTYTDPTLLHLSESSYWLICGFYTLSLHLPYQLDISFLFLSPIYSLIIPSFLLCSHLTLVCPHSSHHNIVFHDHWLTGKWL